MYDIRTKATVKMPAKDLQSHIIPCFFQSARNFSRPISVRGVLYKLAYNLKGDGGYVRPHEGRIHDMEGISHTCDYDLCFETIVIVDGDNLLNQLHSLMADNIQPSNERTDVGSPRLCRHKSLHGRKAECDIGAYTFFRQDLYRL